MDVFWDGYGLDRPSGVAAYGENLAGGLRTLGISPQIIVPGARFLPRLLNSKPLWPRRVARLVEQRAEAGAVLHGLSNFNLVRPKTVRVRTVLTVHDLIPYLCPQGVSTAYLWQLRALLPRALAAADAVICVSEWTRTTVAERYPWAKDKLRVIRHGLAPAAEITANAAGREPTLFYQARGEIYKQISVYLDIVQKMCGQVRGVLLTDARGYAEVRRTHLALLASGRLDVFQNVTRAEYEALFAKADVYVHTSLYEGYCLPAADALRHGVPVVYLTGSATEELLSGGVAIALPPQAGLGDWVGAVNEALGLKGSKNYGANRQKRLLELPSWEDVARSHTAIYSGV